MEIIRGLDSVKDKFACAVTIGTFDGVHLGHLEIINRLKKTAAEQGLHSTLITFDPHPRIIVQPHLKDKIRLLTSLAEKIDVLKTTGLERLIVVNFTRKIADMPYEDFLKNVLLDKVDAKTLVIGYDHAFGKDREGNFANLEKLSNGYGFSLQKVEPYEVDEQIVSSTFIRQFIIDGDVELAAEMLGRNYTLSGKVVHGSARGKDLSFPTANIQPDDAHKLIPANGVYAVDVQFGSVKMKGMLNIGFRPTFNNTHEATIEVHIFNFNDTIYGKELTIYFKKRLRNEKKFESKEALIAQLEIDKQKSLEI